MLQKFLRSSSFAACFLVFLAAGPQWVLGADQRPEKSKTKGSRAAATKDPAVFESLPATFAPDLFAGRQKTDGVLRILTVDERVGFERRYELVRVPVFFHAGEAATDPNSYSIVPAGGGEPVPYQADDIRRDASGKIARMHLYFYIDELKPWARRQFHLQRGSNPAAGIQPLPVQQTSDSVKLASNGVKLTFWTKGDRQGQLNGIETPLGKVAIGKDGLTPRLAVFRLFSGEKEKRPHVSLINFDDPDEIDIRSMRWAAGPLFSKLSVCMSKNGGDSIVEYVYRLPRHGDRFLLDEMIYLDPDSPQKDKVGTGKYAFKTGNILLEGKLTLGDSEQDQQLVKVPAGLRRRLESVHNHFYNALVNEKAGFSLFYLPYVIKGGTIKRDEESGKTVFEGSSELGAGDSVSMRTCWAQAAFIFSKALKREQLWETSCRNFGSLVAVVDEPWATPDDFHALIPQVVKSFWAIKYWGKNWEQEAAMNALAGNLDKAARNLNPPNGSPLKAIGGDPYSFTYIHSATVPLLMFYAKDVPPAQLSVIEEILINAAKRSLNESGKVNKFNFPFMQSFGLALNMHVGTYLINIWGRGRTGDPAAAQRSRDALVDPVVLGVFGRGQRPYGVNYANSDSTDMLYECVSDLWIRATELFCNEDLSIHPAVYARYFDCVDVMADFYQGKVDENGVRTPTWDRASMWRAQSHAHRWEAWAAAPFLGLFAKASDGGKIGITEACYWANYLVGKKINWSELNPIFFAEAMLKHGLKDYRPAKLPGLPSNVKVAQAPGGGNTITWDAVAGENIAGYRIYRSEFFGDIVEWKYLNSPYPGENPGVLVRETTYTDKEGSAESLYMVTAEDKEGRESDWFPDEPMP